MVVYNEPLAQVFFPLLYLVAFCNLWLPNITVKGIATKFRPRWFTENQFEYPDVIAKGVLYMWLFLLFGFHVRYYVIAHDDPAAAVTVDSPAWYRALWIFAGYVTTVVCFIGLGVVKTMVESQQSDGDGNTFYDQPHQGFYAKSTVFIFFAMQSVPMLMSFRHEYTTTGDQTWWEHACFGFQIIWIALMGANIVYSPSFTYVKDTKLYTVDKTDPDATKGRLLGVKFPLTMIFSYVLLRLAFGLNYYAQYPQYMAWVFLDVLPPLIGCGWLGDLDFWFELQLIATLCWYHGYYFYIGFCGFSTDFCTYPANKFLPASDSVDTFMFFWMQKGGDFATTATAIAAEHITANGLVYTSFLFITFGYLAAVYAYEMLFGERAEFNMETHKMVQNAKRVVNDRF